MLGLLILLFVLVPLADLSLLLILSSYIGWQISLALVIISGILGAWLARMSYRSVIRKFQADALKQGLSLELFTDGMMIFFAAGMLLTPGFLTDALGFSLLIPQCRKWYRSRITSWIRKRAAIQIRQFSSSTEIWDDQVVEGEVKTPTDAPNGNSRMRIKDSEPSP
jgi:UPF0716 protein FxsA